MKRLLLMLGVLLSLVGCSAPPPELNVLSVLNHTRTEVEQKFGSGQSLSNDNTLFEYTLATTGTAVDVLYDEQNEASRILVRFGKPVGTSLQALEKVGLGENGIGRAATDQTDSGWYYRNQNFSGTVLSEVHTIGTVGNYGGITIDR